MLSTEEIKRFIDEDKASKKKMDAKIGLNYYEGRHDIEDYKIYYFNDEGKAVLDETRSNIKISHPFFIELIDQCTQYMLSGKDYYIKSDKPELQKLLNEYFDDDFFMELNDLITFAKVEGDSYLYRYVDENFKTRFKFADGWNVVEVAAKYSRDKKDYVIYHYFDRTENKKDIFKIQVWDDKEVHYYKMVDSMITKDDEVEMNPRPHVIYTENEDKYYDTFGDIPFIRLDNNRKRVSDLFVVKDLIDDYDLMACGLSNNLQDVAEGIYVVKGWQGDSLDELTRNIKAKKQVAVGEGGDVDIKTIQVPYQARLAKMEQDEKNIYRFGMGLNTSMVGEGNATNYILKSRYALLDMKCNKLEAQVKKTLRKVVNIVIDEINKTTEKKYTSNDWWFNFDQREVMTNALDNAQIDLVTAQKEQVLIGTLLSLAQSLDQETIVKRICDVLDIDFDDIKGKLPKPQTAEDEIIQAMKELNE